MEDYRVQYLQSSHKAVDAKNLGFLLIEQLLTKYIYISQEAMHGDCIHCKAIVQKYLQMSL